MNSEKFPNVFVISGEDLVYSALEDAKNECADWQTIIEYKAAYTYTPETIRRYKTEAV